jgi:hypothetical protein
MIGRATSAAALTAVMAGSTLIGAPDASAATNYGWIYISAPPPLGGPGDAAQLARPRPLPDGRGRAHVQDSNWTGVNLTVCQPAELRLLDSPSCQLFPALLWRRRRTDDRGSGRPSCPNPELIAEHGPLMPVCPESHHSP